MRQLATLLLVVVSLNAQTPAAKEDPRNSPFYLRDFARLAGNVGGWWSFLTENEKGAFLTGYQTAMKQSYSQNRALCKVLKDGVKSSSDQQAFMNQMSTALLVCERAEDLDGFEKITVNDLDGFYSDRMNQAMVMEWTMEYLRDKILGRKRKGNCWTP